MQAKAHNRKPEADGPAQGMGYILAIAGSLVSRFSMLLLLILLPKQIGLTAYGLFALVITLGEIIEMTASNWYRLVLVRQSVNGGPLDTGLSGRKPGPPMLWLIAGVSALAISAAFALSPFVVEAERLNFTAATALYVLCFILFRLVVAVLQAQGKQTLVGAVEMVRGIIMLAIVAGALILDLHSFFYPAAGAAVAAMVAAIAGFPAIRKDLRATLMQRLQPGAFTIIGLPIVCATLLTYQFGWLDRLIIQAHMGPQLVGLYVAVTAISRQPIDLVLNAMNTQTFPIMMAREGFDDRTIAARTSGVLLCACIFGFGGAAAATALSVPLVEAILPAFDRGAAVVLVAPIAFGAVFLGLKHFVFDNVFHAHGRNWLMLRWFAFVSVATLGLSLLLIPYFGAGGAAAAFVTGAAASLVSSAIVSRRVWVFPIPYSDIARVLMCAGLAGAAAWAAVSALAANAILLLGAGLAVFGLVYLGSLALLMGFSMRTLFGAPWEFSAAKEATL